MLAYWRMRRTFTPPCDRAPRGWYCSLEYGHRGPCPARPRDWNLPEWWRLWRRR